nr:ribonuclease H-like domain-containing protein [Tanacetum cinerariifolium]
MKMIWKKWNMALLSMRADKFWRRIGKKISIQGSDVAGFDKSKVECFNCHKMGHFARESDKVKEGVGYNVVPPPAADLYLSSKKDLLWTGLPEFVNDTITDYNRPSPTVASTSPKGQNKDSFTFEDDASPNTPKPFVKFGSSQNNIDDKGYWDSGCSRHMTCNISYLSDFKPFDGGYVSFGQGGCKITGKGTIKTGKLEFENVYFVKDLKYNLFSVSQICDNKEQCFVHRFRMYCVGKKL